MTRAARRGELHEGEAAAELAGSARAAARPPAGAPRCPWCSRGDRRPRRAARRRAGPAPRTPARGTRRPAGAVIAQRFGHSIEIGYGRTSVRAPALHDRVLLAIDARLEVAVDGVEEVVAVELRVEAEDAAAEQPFEQLVAPRADAEALGVRPGDVPEGEDRRARQPLADQPRREREVVVLHEDDRVVGVDLVARRRRAKRSVDLLVVLPVLAAEDRPRVRDVAERPEPLVGEAVVVALLFLRREPDAPERCTTPRPAARATPIRARRPSRGRPMPLPCATQTPEQARMTGSSAVTRPLAGCTDLDRRRRRRARGCTARGSRRRRRARRSRRWRSESFSRSGVQTPPAPSGSRSALRRSTSSRTSLISGWNSGLCRPPRSRRRSSFVQPRQDAPADDDRHHRGGQRQHGERADEQPLNLGLSPLRKAEVVEQHHEAERLLFVDERQRAQVDGAAFDLDHRMPARPLRRRRIGGGPDSSRHGAARHHHRPVGRRCQQRAILAAGRYGEEALVVRDGGEQRPHARGRSPGPVGGQFLARAGERQFGAAGHIALEPVVQRLADEVGTGQNQEAEARQDADCDPQGS